MKHQNPVTPHENLALNNFVILGRLGRGSTAHVFKIQSIRTNKCYASKVIEKSSLGSNAQKLLQEIQIHKSLHHHNIVEFITHLQDEENHYILTEYCEGGQTTNILMNEDLYQDWPLYQEKVIQIAFEIGSALDYLHNDLNIFHGDLKLANILIAGQKSKLCDFGFSDKLNQYNQRLRQNPRGTFMYLSPEILKAGKNIYPKQGDIWGLGISLLVLILRGNPYTATNQKQLKQQIMLANYRRPSPKDIHPQLLQLIEKILQPNHSKRITARQLINHPIFKKYHQTKKENPIKQGSQSQNEQSNNKQQQCDHTIDSLTSLKYVENDNNQFQEERLTNGNQETNKLKKICALSLSSQKHFIKNGYIEVTKDKQIRVSMKKVNYWIDKTGENLYLQFSKKKGIENSNPKSANTKVKRYRWESLSEQKNLQKIISFYNYAYELTELIKKQSNIIYEGWQSDTALFYWQRYCNIKKQKQHYGYFREMNLELRYTASSPYIQVKNGCQQFTLTVDSQNQYSSTGQSQQVFSEELDIFLKTVEKHRHEKYP